MASTLRIALGTAPLPNSLAGAPPIYGILSTWTLITGSGIGAVGIAWRRGENGYREIGLLVEQFGCIIVSLGAISYGTALGIVNDFAKNSNPWISMGFTYGLAIGAIARVVQIQLYVRGRKERDEGET